MNFDWQSEVKPWEFVVFHTKDWLWRLGLLLLLPGPRGRRLQRMRGCHGNSWLREFAVHEFATLIEYFIVDKVLKTFDGVKWCWDYTFKLIAKLFLSSSLLLRRGSQNKHPVFRSLSHLTVAVLRRLEGRACANNLVLQILWTEIFWFTTVCTKYSVWWIPWNEDGGRMVGTVLELLDRSSQCFITGDHQRLQALIRY